MGLLRGRLQEPGAASIEPGAGDPVDDAYQALWAPRAWMRPLRKDRAVLAGEASAAAAKVESSPPPIPDPAAGAFFDVDNTLMRGASIYYFARGLAARKMFSPMDLARMAWGQACYRMRGAENADHIDAARQAALAFVAGHRASDIANDLPMLRLVGHPTVVNPDAELRAEARANHWPVHDFRSGRKATLIALPTAAGAGAVAGGIVAGLALRRRHAAGR